MNDLAYAFQRLWSKRLLIAVVTLLSVSGGLVLALTRPVYYESRAVFSLRSPGFVNDPLNVGLEGARGSPPALLYFAKQVLTSEELFDTIIRDTQLLPLVLPPNVTTLKHSLSDSITLRLAKEHLKSRVVRIQIDDENQLILLGILAKDTSAAVRLVWAFHDEANRIVQRRVRQQVGATLNALREMRNASQDPTVTDGIDARMQGEIEKRLLVSAGFLNVVRAPVGALYTTEPRKKQLVALSFLSGLFFSAFGVLLKDKGFRSRIRRRSTSGGDLEPEQTSDKIGAFRIVGGAVLAFMVLYNISFKLAPSISTARIAFLVLLGFGLEKGLRRLRVEAEKNPFTVLIFLWCIFYAFVAMITAGNGDSNQFSRNFHFLAYCFFGATLFLGYVRTDWRTLHLCIAIATLGQSAIHIYSFFGADYRSWVDAILVQDSNFALTLGRRPPGFSNGAGAAFSVIQALGLLSTLISLRETRKPWTAFWLSLGVPLLFVSSSVAGRTGMLMSGVFLGYFVFFGGRRISFFASVAVVALATGFVVFNDEIRLYLFFVDPMLERDFGAMTHSVLEIFRGGRVDSITELSSMAIPQLGFETLLGVGRARVEIGAGHDAGFVQTYYSIGLLMAATFYITFAIYVARLAFPVREGLPLALLLAGVMFGIETKEPFIFKYAIAFYVIAYFRARLHQARFASNEVKVASP